MLLFWNGKSADDKAVRAALKKVDRWNGRVSVQVAPIRKISKYGRISRGVDVEQSPTIVVTDPELHAETLVGYVDTTTIDQTVVDAFRNTTGLFKDAYLRRVNGVCTRHGKAFAGIPNSDGSVNNLARGSAASSPTFNARWARWSSDFKAVKAPKKWRAFKRATVADNAAYAAYLSSVSRSSAVNPSIEPAAVGEQRSTVRRCEPAASASTSAWTRSTSRSAAPKPEPGLDSPLVELFREHLEHPAGRGLRPAGAFDGSAGGAACGDLDPHLAPGRRRARRRRRVRRLRLRDDDRRRIGGRHARTGRARARRRARRRAHDRRRAGRPLTRQVPRRRPGRRRAARRARRRRPRRRGARPPTPAARSSR